MAAGEAVRNCSARRVRLCSSANRRQEARSMRYSAKRSVAMAVVRALNAVIFVLFHFALFHQENVLSRGEENAGPKLHVEQSDEAHSANDKARVVRSLASENHMAPLGIHCSTQLTRTEQVFLDKDDGTPVEAALIDEKTIERATWV